MISVVSFLPNPVGTSKDLEDVDNGVINIPDSFQGVVRSCLEQLEDG